MKISFFQSPYHLHYRIFCADQDLTRQLKLELKILLPQPPTAGVTGMQGWGYSKGNHTCLYSRILEPVFRTQHSKTQMHLEAQVHCKPEIYISEQT